jgi:molybdopterin-synthase adenylyltransferase
MEGASFSVAMSSDVDAVLARHLLRTDHQEDICFGLWYPSTGGNRTTALLHSVILPREGERQVHGTASFSAAYFERALLEAAQARAGLALLHSHPHGGGWQRMSEDDVAAELGHAASVFGATKHPFVGLTLAGDRTWSARFWQRTAPRHYERRWCKTVRVVGERLRMSYNEAFLPAPAARLEQLRTVSAWGEESQRHLVRVRVGIVGAGSVGGMIAEALARTGSIEVVLIDFDRVKRHNLDRLIYASERDIDSKKVESLASRLTKIATAKPFTIQPIDASVCDEKGLRAALDCDVLFSCVDRPRGRHVLNSLAYAHLIPVVDGGISVRANRSGHLAAADWRAHVAVPGKPCLHCLGQYLASDVSLESEGLLDDPRYIEGLAKDHHLRASENVFAFSMACGSLQMLQFLSVVVAPLGRSDIGAQLYHFVGGFMENGRDEACHKECLMASITAIGDIHPIPADTPHQHDGIQEAPLSKEKMNGHQQHMNWLTASVWVARFTKFFRRKNSIKQG